MERPIIIRTMDRLALSESQILSDMLYLPFQTESEL
jgi:hypothetical protein